MANQPLMGEYSFILAAIQWVVVERWDSSVQHRTLDFQRSTLLNRKRIANHAKFVPFCQIRFPHAFIKAWVPQPLKGTQNLEFWTRKIG